MTKSTIIDDALETIVQQIILCLQCDRATCFVADHTNNELWSKVAKGVSGVIKFPITVGLAGITFHNYILTNKFITPQVMLFKIKRC